MNLDYAKYVDGLVPAIVQDAASRAVLMLGFMNAEAVEATFSTGLVTFFSRSKQRLWTKGETSGNYLDLVSISADCDADTLLIIAKPRGPVCHIGAATCFGDSEPSLHFLSRLEEIIGARKNEPVDGSYVSSLFANGLNRIAQKVGEEAVELVIAAKDTNIEAFRNEAADLLFHYMILLQERGLVLQDVVNTLKARER